VETPHRQSRRAPDARSGATGRPAGCAASRPREPQAQPAGRANHRAGPVISTEDGAGLDCHASSRGNPAGCGGPRDDAWQMDGPVRRGYTDSYIVSTRCVLSMYPPKSVCDGVDLPGGPCDARL